MPGHTGAGVPQLQGRLVVLAASSLIDAFRDGEARLERSHSGFRATYSFAGSQQQVNAVRDGARADVVATADAVSMGRLVDARLVERPVSMARNRLEVAVARGNPRRITGLRDLGRPDLAVVLADAAVPAGRFARDALARAGVASRPRSNELNVRAALEKVESGDADAAVVYATDVSSAGGRVSGVAIPEQENALAAYPIAILRSAQSHEAAAAFVREAVSGEVHAALLRRGFLAP